MGNWPQEFEKYVGKGDKFQELPDDDTVDKDLVEFFGSDIGRHVGFERVAAHHVVVKPNRRSSFPHAESLEEEFVYILKGNVDLWLNGYIFPLKAGHAAGFPAGTGIAHSFINNSQKNVELLVFGERTKEENLCSFPINPELKESCGIWWENPPDQQLGPHDGKPGPIKSEEYGAELPSCVAFCPDLVRPNNFHYPGDNETFGYGNRLTDALNLKPLGINYEILNPGKRSTFPHAHTHEEEFVFILEGEATVWMNGFEKQLCAGEFVAFPSNTGISHAIINNSNSDIKYFSVGETEEFQGERIFYPLNELRNRECARINWFWSDVPDLPWGPHGGFPKNPIEKDRMSLKICQPQSNWLVISKPWAQITGEFPSPSDIETYSHVENPVEERDILLMENDGEPLGLVDLVYSAERKATISGLFFHSANFAELSRWLDLIENYLKRATKSDKIVVSQSDAASGFFEARDYVPSNDGHLIKAIK